MGIFSIITQLFSACSDGKSGFKPGLLTESGYHVEGDKVYFYGGFSNASILELPSADAKSFLILSKKYPKQEFASAYGIDDKHVYLNGKLIKDADPKSIVVLGYNLAKDSNRVFDNYNTISEDPAHFENLTGSLYRDSKNVFHNGAVVSEDAQHLRFEGKSDWVSYYSDGKGIIVSNGNRIDNVDVDTFRPLSFGYSLDKSKVYVMEATHINEIADADPATFKVLDQHYTLDARRVYLNGKTIKQADPGTFRILNAEVYCSLDKLHAYHRGEIIPNFNPSEFPSGKSCKYCNAREIVFEK